MDRLTRICLVVLIVIGLTGSAISFSILPNDGVYKFVPAAGLGSFFQLFLVQLTQAIVIAAIVFEVVEYQHKKRIAAQDKMKFKSTTQAVARSVFSSFYDEEVIEEVFATVFDKHFLRENCTVKYILKDLDDFSDIISMEIITKWELKNVGRTSLKVPVGAMISNQFAQFDDNDLVNSGAIEFVNIGKDKFDAKRIKRLNDQIDANCEINNVSIANRSLKPGKSLPVHIGFKVTKLADDSEVMRTFYPTMGVEVTVIDKTNKNLQVGIKEIGSDEFGDAETTPTVPGEFTWTYDKVLLPNNGWVVYWANLAKPIAERQ